VKRRYLTSSGRNGCDKASFRKRHFPTACARLIDEGGSIRFQVCSGHGNTDADDLPNGKAAADQNHHKKKLKKWE
jgi:hypothetical protein